VAEAKSNHQSERHVGIEEGASSQHLARNLQRFDGMAIAPAFELHLLARMAAGACISYGSLSRGDSFIALL